MRDHSTLGAVAVILVVALGATGCLTIDLFGAKRGPLQETRLSGIQGAPKILLMDIRGVIRSQEGDDRVLQPVAEGTAARVREELERARADDAIRALLIRVDSPGGSATDSDLVYQEIVRFKNDRNVPVVAQLMGTAASGGYYVAMAADEVRALRTTVTGSIGVIFLGVSVSGLMEKLGIYDQTLTSGSQKDALSPLRRMTDAERDHLQSIVDDYHARFLEIVARGRPDLSDRRIRELADGRIYSAPQALEVGLIDAIGNLEAAVDRVEELAELESSQVVTYHRQREYRQNLYTEAPNPNRIRLDLGSMLGFRPPPPGFYYLWWP